MSQTKMQGSQFRKQVQFQNTLFTDCEQIVVCVYAKRADTKVYFVKVADETNFLGAQLIQQTNADAKIFDLWFTKEITTALAPDNYELELKYVIAGTLMPIIKSKTEVFEIIKSLTK